MQIIKFIYIIFSVCLSCFLFCGHMITTSYPLLFLIIGCGIMILLLEKKKIKINKNILTWLIFGILIFISSMFSNNFELSSNYAITFAIIILLSLIIMNIDNKKWFNYFKKIALFLGMCHICFTLLYEAFPDIIQPICKLVLKPDDYLMNVYLHRSFGNPGLTGQTGINGWFISITIGMLVLGFIEDKNRKKISSIIHILLILISFIALLLTNKRGFILYSVIALIVIIFSRNKKDARNKKVLPYICIISILMIFIVSKNSDLTQVFERFINNETDISSGRLPYYNYMFDVFLDNPILGIGTLSIDKHLGNMGHNIYLQVLCENGLFIFIILIIAIASSYKIAKNNYLESRDSLTAQNCLYCWYIQLIFILYGLTGNPLYTLQNYAIYFICVGCMNQIYNEKRR